MTTATLPALIQQFFTDRLCTQMEASPNTIAGYRDTFRLLLRFASAHTGRVPTKLKIEDIDAVLVGDFLTHVETKRHNGARSRNTRLAAIRSLTVQRWMRCWPRPIDPHGSDVATMSSSSLLCKQDYAHRNSLASAVAIS